MCRNTAERSKKNSTSSSKPDVSPQVGTRSSASPGSMATNMVDLKSCSAGLLAEHLWEHRFSQDPVATKAFLQKAMDALEEKAQKENQAQDQPGRSEQHLGEPMLKTPLETSLLNPRAGKCSIQLHDEGFFVVSPLKDPSAKLVLPAEALSHMIFFAKAEDYKVMGPNAISKKQPSPHLVLLNLDPKAEEFQFLGKPIKEQICFPLPTTKGVGPTGPQGETGWQEATQAWRKLLEKCLGHSSLTVAQVAPQEGGPFLSFQVPGQSTTTGGMPFVKCYHGVQDGALYPMKEGLLFFKPPKFLPRSELASIACGRGSGGQSSSRYVDMVIQQHDNTTQEFTNIQREELGVLNKYIHQVLIPAMQADAATGTVDASKDGSEVDNGAQDEDTDGESTEEEVSDEEDENFENGEEDEEGHDKEDESESEAEDDEFEVVEDDFAKQLAKEPKDLDRPRASRSRSNKRKDSPGHSPASQKDVVEAVVASDLEGIDDEDFEIIEAAPADKESPPKKSRS